MKFLLLLFVFFILSPLAKAALFTNDASLKNENIIGKTEEGEDTILLGKRKIKAVFTLGAGFSESSISGTGIAQLRYKTNVDFYDFKFFTYLDKQKDSKDLAGYFQGNLKMSSKILSYPSLYSWSFYRLTTDNVTKGKSVDLKILVGTGYGLEIYTFDFGIFSLNQNLELSLAYEYASLSSYKKNIGSAYFVTGTEMNLDSKLFTGKIQLTHRKSLFGTNAQTDVNKIPDQSHLESYQELNYKFLKSFYVSLGFSYLYYTELELDGNQLRHQMSFWLGFSYKISNSDKI